MPKPIPLEIRKHVVAVYSENGLTMEEAAKELNIGIASLNRWLRKQRETGSLEPKPHGGGRPSKIQNPELLLHIIKEKPDMTLEELAAAYSKQSSSEVSSSSIFRVLKKMKYTVKKSLSMPQKGTAPESKSCEKNSKKK